MIVTDSQSKEKRASSDFEDTGDVSSGKQQKLERVRCCNMLFQVSAVRDLDFCFIKSRHLGHPTSRLLKNKSVML